MTALKAGDVARYPDRPDLDHGVFLVFGPDAGLVRETGARLVAHFLARPGTADDATTIDQRDLDDDPARLGREARIASLFGGSPVISVRNAGGRALLASLGDLIETPAEAVVVLEAGNLPKSDPLRRLVEGARGARALPCYADTAEGLMSMIRQSFSAAGIAADPDALASLRDLLGNDRAVTRRELEKLELFAAESGRLTREDVLALCGDNSMLAMDRIVDAAAAGHAARLDEALAGAWRSGLDAGRLLGAALQHLSWLRRLRPEIDAGRSPRSTLEASRPRPHFSRIAALEQQLRLWDDGALAIGCARLHAAIADTRRNAPLARTLAERGLLAVCRIAAQR